MVMSSKGSIDTFQIDQTVHVLFKLGLERPQKSRNNSATLRNIIFYECKPISCSIINAVTSSRFRRDKYLMGGWKLPKRSLISSNILVRGIRIATSEDSEKKA